MGKELGHDMQESTRHRRAFARLVCGLALACSGCAQVLGIPTDVVLVPPPGVAPSADAGSARAATAPVVTPGGVEPQGTAGAAGPVGLERDGVLPADGVGAIDGVDAGGPHAVEAVGVSRDAGPALVADAGARPPACAPVRVPVDVIVALDNSGSMAEECEAFEAALPAFVARLAEAAVDYRLILVSRQRQDARGESEAADTSVCIAAPVSGLAACPSASPAPGERFFQYSIKLDADDSFERLLESFDEPDPFGLTALGWSEWLRPGSLPIFIEITDADSRLSPSDFASGLAARSPERFGAQAPGFVFHSVLGVAEKPTPSGVYEPSEPIQLERCSGPGSSIDSAGPAYQELSRATGGLRLSICPPSALGARLQVLADDAIARLEPPCAG